MAELISLKNIEKEIERKLKTIGINSAEGTKNVLKAFTVQYNNK